jgi:hypothetical protein
MLKRMEDVDKLFFPREFAMDLLVYTPEQLEKRRKMQDPFVIDVIDKGKLLYAR